MPELPEVETVARALNELLSDRTVVSIWTSGQKLRAPINRPVVEQAALRATVRYVRRIVGKYLWIDFSSGGVLLVHLGMSGQLFVCDRDRPREAHTHAVFGLDDGRELRFVDPRRFGILKGYTRGGDALDAPEIQLGPDPLGRYFGVGYLAEQLFLSRGIAVKQFLLDQVRVPGLGNIYASEVLHVAGISPRRRANTIGLARAERLHAAIRSVLLDSIERRGTTLRDYVSGDGTGGENQHFLRVYGRAGEPCPTCGAPIKQIVQGARSTYYCSRCQR